MGPEIEDCPMKIRSSNPANQHGNWKSTIYRGFRSSHVWLPKGDPFGTVTVSILSVLPKKKEPGERERETVWFGDLAINVHSSGKISGILVLGLEHSQSGWHRSGVFQFNPDVRWWILPQAISNIKPWNWEESSRKGYARKVEAKPFARNYPLVMSK